MTPTIVAIRSDLVRVARLTHEAEGYAPSLCRYRALGRFGEMKVRGVAGGYGANGVARLCWSDAVQRYGLRPWHEAYHPPDTSLLADLRRVAVLCGHPRRMPTLREYREHGEYAPRTVQSRFGGWNAAGPYAGLEPNPPGGDTPYMTGVADRALNPEPREP